MTTSEDPKHPWYGFTQYKKSFGGGRWIMRGRGICRWIRRNIGYIRGEGGEPSDAEEEIIYIRRRTIREVLCFRSVWVCRFLSKDVSRRSLVVKLQCLAKIRKLLLWSSELLGFCGCGIGGSLGSYGFEPVSRFGLVFWAYFFSFGGGGYSR